MKKILVLFLYLFFIQYISPQDFICLVDGLRLRTAPNLKYQVITTIEKGEVLSNYGTGKAEIIDHINGNWFKVKTQNNYFGWVFGGYLNRFLELESPSGYTIYYPEKWTIREQNDQNAIHLKISSYDKLAEINPGEETPITQINIDVLIFDNIFSTAEEWARTIPYIESVTVEKSYCIGISRSKYKKITHTIFVKNNKGIIMHFYPPDSEYKKAAENILKTFAID